MRPTASSPHSAWRSTPSFPDRGSVMAANFNSLTHHCFDLIPQESLKGTITRRLITGERMMIAHVYLKKGDDVPRHHHENEQLTYILTGALQFWFGDRSEEHTSELQSLAYLVCRLLLEKKNI